MQSSAPGYLQVQFESVGLSLFVVLASLAGKWVWPGRTYFPSTSFAPHCGGWKVFFLKWETHQVRSASLIGVRDTLTNRLPKVALR